MNFIGKLLTLPVALLIIGYFAFTALGGTQFGARTSESIANGGSIEQIVSMLHGDSLKSALNTDIENLPSNYQDRTFLSTK